VVAFIGGLFGGAVWWALVGVRLAFIAVANGLLHPLLKHSRIAMTAEYYLSEVEKVYTNMPLGGVIGGSLLRQDVWRVCSYTAIWVVCLVCKFLFDIQVS
jgi:uncharacterized membrane protein